LCRFETTFPAFLSQGHFMFAQEMPLVTEPSGVIRERIPPLLPRRTAFIG
jgi:hypothetical protein